MKMNQIVCLSILCFTILPNGLKSCPTNCKFCTSDSFQNCMSCYPGYGVFHDFVNPKNADTCIPMTCPSNCYECENCFNCNDQNSSCSMCKSGYAEQWKSQSPTICCQQNCKSCEPCDTCKDGSYQCTSCNDGMVIQQNTGAPNTCVNTTAQTTSTNLTTSLDNITQQLNSTAVNSTNGNDVSSLLNSAQQNETDLANQTNTTQNSEAACNFRNIAIAIGSYFLVLSLV